jgi:hypothetical protein
MKNIEYEFHGGNYTTSVNRQKEIITMYERGGWSRDYSLTFVELMKNAKNWDVQVDLNAPDKVVAEIATNIMLANNAVYHGLDPFDYLPRTNKITDPRDKDVLNKFEALFDKYTIAQILFAMTEEKKELLKEALLQNKE